MDRKNGIAYQAMIVNLMTAEIYIELSRFYEIEKSTEFLEVQLESPA